MKSHTIPSVVVKFISLLSLGWPKDRKQNLITMITGLLILEGIRSISRISREIALKKEPSSLIKFVSRSPWSYEDLQVSARTFQFQEALKNCSPGTMIKVFFSIDSRNLEKYKDSNDLSGFAPLYDHVKQRYIRGRAIVTAHLTINNHSFSFGFYPYYSEKVRHAIKRENPQARFASKPTMALWMIDSLKALLDSRPDLSFFVIILFDCEFAANRILRKIYKYHYHFICGLKKNRKLDGKQLKIYSQLLTRQDFHREKVVIRGGKEQTFWLTSITGRLKDFRPMVRVLMSKQSPRSECRYYATDLIALMDKSMLLLMMRRWDIEVDHLYLAQHCGIDDFECRSDEAILKYLALGIVSLSCAQWMNQKQERKETVAETIRGLKKDFYLRNLKQAMRMVQQNYSWDTIVRKFNARAA